MQERKFQESIDACRPGSDDLRMPEMAHLAKRVAEDPKTCGEYERAQRLDATIGKVFQDVPVPDGLSARLLASLAASASRRA